MSSSVVPHSRPWVGELEAEAAAAVVRSRMLAQGAITERLEDAWCAATGMTAAACTASGLGALRLALHALGVAAGDEVIVPAYSCVALLNAPLALGATPVLADVVGDDWTLDPADARSRVTERTRALVAVDLFGVPARLDELGGPGLPVVEDCAHGIGGTTSAGPFGGGSEVSIASFYATKMIGAGEGGIVAARDGALVARVREARDYGDRPPDARHLNDKLTDVGAAIALAQLERLDEMLSARAERARRYAETLASLSESGALVLPADVPGRIWYRYAVRLLEHRAPDVCLHARNEGVHLEQPVWDLRGAAQWRGDLPVAAKAFDHVVSLPLYPDLTESEQERVVTALTRAVGA